MAKMRAVQVARPGAALEMVEREIPSPGSRRSGSRASAAWGATMYSA